MAKSHTVKAFGKKKSSSKKLLQNFKKKKSTDGNVEVSQPSTSSSSTTSASTSSSSTGVIISSSSSSSGVNVMASSCSSSGVNFMASSCSSSGVNVMASSCSSSEVNVAGASSSSSSGDVVNVGASCCENVGAVSGLVSVNMAGVSSAPVVVKPSASARKISAWESITPSESLDIGNDDNSSSNGADISATFKLSSISSFISHMLCPSCGTASLELNCTPKVKSGLYRRYVGSCKECDHEIPLETEPRNEQDSLTKVTVLACKEAGISYEQLSRLYSITNHIGINAPKYRSTAHELYEDCKQALPLHFQSVNRLVRDNYSAIENRPISDEEVIDIAVSFDGTWQKRGRTSHHGVGVVIDVQSGYVLDFEVLSNFCVQCEKRVNASEEWKREHAESGKCEKDFDGNSGAMEAEAAVRIWKRSVCLHRMRYVTMLSDGDAKGYNEVSKVQGMYEVTKEECINHVSKRVYNRLTTLKSKCVGRARIHGKGRMTDKMMREFQSYYGKAIRKNGKVGGSIEQLRADILAIVDHTISSDADPRHHNCPHGPDTWCKYNQLALGLIDELPPNPKPKLPIWIGEKIRPVFVDLSTTKILQSCLRALTQNANESFNSTIWLRCPKVLWSSAFSVYVATALACLKFNKGAVAVFDVLQNTTTEGRQVTEARRQDRRRLYRSSSMVAARRSARRYRKKQCQSSKGKDSYNPGAY